MKNLFLGLMTLVAFQLSAQVTAPQPSPSAKTDQIIGLTSVKIDYSRPAMRGRAIFGDLVPFGKLWRTGANANTIISFSDDVKIDGKDLKKGSYAIYSVPNEKSWDLIFYSDTKNWGLPAKWDESKEALRTTVATTDIPWKMESFTILIDDLSNDGASLNIMWENTMVSSKIWVPTTEKTIASIKKTMAGPSANDYFSAAQFYHQEGTDLNSALEYAKKAVQLRPEAYWMWRGLSLIQADLNMKKEAIKSAETSLEGAEKAGNQDYIKMNKESIAQWSK